MPAVLGFLVVSVMLANTPTPSEAEPPRMEPLARLPVFLALEGRRTVVAGGTPAAAWKAELLSAAGSAVEVYAASLMAITVDSQAERDYLARLAAALRLPPDAVALVQARLAA